MFELTTKRQGVFHFSLLLFNIEAIHNKAAAGVPKQ